MCCYVPCIEPGPLHIYKLIWYISEREARTEAGRLVLVISSFLTDWRKFLIYSRHHLSFGDYMWLQISSPILWAVLLLMLKLYVVSIFLCSSLLDFLSKFPFLTTVASRFLVISSYLLPLHLAQTSFGTSDQLLSVSDSLQPRESQHARPPCPSPTPRVHSDSHVKINGVSMLYLRCLWDPK